MDDAPPGLLAGGRGRVCVSLAAATSEALSDRLGDAAAGDVVELRLDAMSAARRPGVEGLRQLLARCPCPAIVTCRPGDEGGEGARQQLLVDALEAGAWAVDVELDAPFAASLVGAHRQRVVLSHHWGKRAHGVDEICRRAAAMAPAVIKLVAPADELADAEALLEAGRRLRAAGQAAATFGLGDTARASRLLDFAAGGALMYVSVEGGTPTAAGQWPARWVRSDLRLEAWRPGAGRFGLLGNPLGQSLSPALFNLAFALDGSGAAYVPLPAESFEVALSMATSAGLRGLSVTMPFKRVALGHCRADALSQRIGAANTLTRVNGEWHGSNTDGPAVRQVLESHMPLRGSRVLILGAGGAARAAAVVLQDAGARIVVANRTAAAARELASLVGGESVDWAGVGGLAVDAAINATSLGMSATAPDDLSTFQPRGSEIVMDLVYRPLHTPWLRRARERGCVVIHGLEVFLAQGAAQFRRWMGHEPPLRAWRQEARSRLQTAEG